MTTSDTATSRHHEMRAEARRLRVDPGLSRSQLMKIFGVGNGTLTEWLRGIEPPEWTRLPNAKDEVRQKAAALRREGRTVPEIAATLGVSKSSAYLWTRDLPLDGSPEAAAERRSRHSRAVAEARWEPYRRERDKKREETLAGRSAWVGSLSDREVILLGAVAYWCEGAKEKPWRANAIQMQFINSDPRLILLFLRYQAVLGVNADRLKFRLSIHESSNVVEAAAWWAKVVGVPVEAFQRPTLKKHNPVTVRQNVGESYRGCLVVTVLKSRTLYWETEAVMEGVALDLERSRPAIM
ncbi:helix-turn-helix domain-containing protein [Actinoplanes sp. CA-252034]|uniref:helix-turn-helix domain-containing protein n=1 Tax=Actinoplanes sp. CA-252034 TaxID=3239906 RepID=UPI003D971575